MLGMLSRMWGEQCNKLKAKLRETDLRRVDYFDLVKMTFEVVVNQYPEQDADHIVDIEGIREIDHGDYQGTKLFVIPLDTYQPWASDYLFTYVGYGSCTLCDTLMGIQPDWEQEPPYDDETVLSFLSLCAHILSNATQPYGDSFEFEGEMSNE